MWGGCWGVGGPGFPRRGRGAKPHGGSASLIFGQNCPDHCIKIGPRGERHANVMQWQIQDFSKAVCQPLRGRQPIIWPICPENCMKMKKFWLGGARPQRQIRGKDRKLSFPSNLASSVKTVRQSITTDLISGFLGFWRGLKWENILLFKILIHY